MTLNEAIEYYDKKVNCSEFPNNSDLISRQAAIDELHGKDPSQIWDTADVEVWLNALPSTQSKKRMEERTETHARDLISRQAAIDALWKALYEYEDKTEKQFEESEDLDVGNWIGHRIFIQNMNDIDRQMILNLPPAQPERKTGSAQNAGINHRKNTCFARTAAHTCRRKVIK